MDLEYRKIEKVVRDVFEDYMGSGKGVELANKWQDGDLVLRPGSRDQQEKVIPMDTFFHKIVMLRESLRVLEQKINNAPEFDEARKVELQQYISRVYGTLTTFNVLFADKDDKFSSQSTR
jgi:hypothetical protein